MVEPQHAFAAEGYDDVFHTGLIQRDRRFADVVFTVYRHAGQKREFGFVRHDKFAGFDLIQYQIGLRGRGVEQHGNAVFFAEFYRRIYGFGGDFQLQNDELAFFDVFRRRVDVGGSQQFVGAFDDDDGVARFGVDEDGGDAAGRVAFQDVARVDVVAPEVFDGVFGENVVAHAGKHQYFRTQFRGGDRLVRAFAAAAEFEIGRFDGFSFDRHTVDVGNQVDHVGTDNCDVHSYYSCF